MLSVILMHAVFSQLQNLRVRMPAGPFRLFCTFSVKKTKVFGCREDQIVSILAHK